MLRCWQRDSNNINTAKESGVGSGAERKRVCVCVGVENVFRIWVPRGLVRLNAAVQTHPKMRNVCFAMITTKMDELFKFKYGKECWDESQFGTKTPRFVTLKNQARSSRVCMHTLSHTHADTHIDHRTCRKMSKSDYLINVHSTRWWPAFFFSYATELVLNALDIHHQYKYVFMLYERYKNSSTVRLFVHILCTCMMGPCWSSLRVWMLYVGISEISPGSFLFFSFQSLFNGIEDSSWTHGLLQCSSI